LISLRGLPTYLVFTIVKTPYTRVGARLMVAIMVAEELVKRDTSLELDVGLIR
jgi:hypothetical protein